LIEQRAYSRQGDRGVPVTHLATALRGSIYYQRLPTPTLRDAKWHSTQQPIFFEQRYISHELYSPVATIPKPVAPSYAFPSAASPSSEGPNRAVHLVVFVHGFHGNSYDLRTMRNQLALTHPQRESLRFLCSSTNEGEAHAARAHTRSLVKAAPP